MTFTIRWIVPRALAIAIVVWASASAHAADAPDPAAGPAVTELPDVVVVAPRVTTPLRADTLVSDVARAVTVADVKDLRDRALLSSLDALDSSIGVWVEKRTSQTSDPVVRGLSGGNVLALVDGNTLSTFWGEGGFAGDDMYGKIDPDMLDRIEVVRGPSSVLYGSNALGGVINFITRRSPLDYTERGVAIGGRARLTAATATHASRFRVEHWGASRSLRWLVGATYWDNGDTVDGSGEVQNPSGGEGGYANAALDIRIGARAELGLTYQETANEQVYRYYRPTQDNENQRTAFAAVLKLEGLGDTVPFADRAELRGYWQDKRDVRSFYDASGSKLRRGVADWETLQAGIHLSKALCDHELSYGFDTQVTWAESPDDEQFTIQSPLGGPKAKAAPDTVWSSYGAYVQDIFHLSPRFTLTLSARADVLQFRSEVDALYVPPGGLDPQADEFRDTEVGLVGGAQGLYRFTSCWSAFGGWTRGFRQFAPRFGATQQGFGVVVPSRLLDPVTADQFELGVRHASRGFNGQVVAYHTIFSNFQNLVLGTFQGQDWYDFNGNSVEDPNEKVYVTSANGKAYVQGVEVEGRVDLHEWVQRAWACGWSMSGGFAWNYGADEKNDIPLRHTHPAYAILALRWDHPDPGRGLWVEAEAKFVRRYDRIPPDRLANDSGYFDDPQDASSGKRRSYGLPGYSVLDLRGGAKVADHLTVSVGLENVFDKLYRPAHARWDAPGRNVTVSLEFRF